MKKMFLLFCLAGVGYMSAEACEFSVVPVDATCNGYSNGAVYAWANNGTFPFSYSIGGAFQSSGTFTGLAPGNYTLTCKDATGCTRNYAFTISQPSAVSVTATSTPVSCNGGNNGSITISASGGTPDYYLYSLGSGYQGSNTFNGRTAGTYTATVKDYNGCTGQVNVNVTQPSAISVSANITHVTTNGGNDGSITVNASGGTPPYIYSVGGTFQSSNVFNGLTAGPYTVTVIDANDCSDQVYVYIFQASALSFNTNENASAAYDQEKVTMDDINVFPNPAQDQLNIEPAAGTTQGMYLQIMNAMGQVVHAQMLGPDRSAIDVSMLPEGTYIVHLSGSGQPRQRVMVIRR